MLIRITTSAIAIMLFAGSTINAQNNFTTPQPDRFTSQFGIHTGPGVSIMFNEHPRQNPRLHSKPALGSFAFGASYQFNFTPHIALRAEANYERKGDILYNTSQLVQNDAGNIVQYAYTTDRISYLTIPVMARFSFGKTVRFFANTGLYAGFRTGAIRTENTTTYLNQSEATIQQRLTDLSPNTRKVDGGVVTGLGMAIPFARVLSFTFEVRNNTSFTPVNTVSDAMPVKMYNSNTNFLFGLAVNINGVQKALPLDQNKTLDID